MITKRMLLVPALVAVLAGCGKEQPPEPGVVAMVGSEKVTEAEIEESVSSYQQGMQQFMQQGMPGGPEKDLREKIKDHLINAKVVLAAAREENVTVSDAELDGYLTRVKGTPYWDQVKKLRKMEDAELREKIRDEILIMKYLQERVPQGPPADISKEEIENFYGEHKSEFKMPSKVRASHILIKAKSDEAAQKKLEPLLVKLQAGEKFADLAKKHSQDSNSAKKGGDLGYFEKGDLLPEFDATAFMLPVGKVSPPFKTRLGYHLLVVTDSKDEKIAPLKDVRRQIEQMLAMKHNAARLETYVMDLRKKMKVKIY